MKRTDLVLDGVGDHAGPTEGAEETQRRDEQPLLPRIAELLTIVADDPRDDRALHVVILRKRSHSRPNRPLSRARAAREGGQRPPSPFAVLPAAELVETYNDRGI